MKTTMNRLTLATSAVLVALALAAGCGPRDASQTATGRYASVNGLKMYYEIHGTGRPLVLLHGALCTIDGCFGKFLPSLAKTRQVIAIEQQAHGRTADIGSPLDLRADGRGHRRAAEAAQDQKRRLLRL